MAFSKSNTILISLVIVLTTLVACERLVSGAESMSKGELERIMNIAVQRVPSCLSESVGQFRVKVIVFRALLKWLNREQPPMRPNPPRKSKKGKRSPPSTRKPNPLEGLKLPPELLCRLYDGKGRLPPVTTKGPGVDSVLPPEILCSLMLPSKNKQGRRRVSLRGGQDARVRKLMDCTRCEAFTGHKDVDGDPKFVKYFADELSEFKEELTSCRMEDYKCCSAEREATINYLDNLLNSKEGPPMEDSIGGDSKAQDDDEPRD